MDEYTPHSFDTRGFLFAFVFFAAIAALLGATRYGTTLASEHIMKKEVGVAAAQVATEAQLAELRAKHDAELLKAASPSAFSVGAKLPPRVSAKTFIVGDVDTGVVFAHKNVAAPYPIASITKLLTAYTAQELLAPTSTVTMTEIDRRYTEGTPGSIQVDEEFSLQDILYPLLTESNNSVAFALARAASTTLFMEKVRENAKKAGMAASTFEEPSGLSENNATNAVDIFLLTRFLHENAPNILALTRTTGKTITAKSGRSYAFANFNTFYANQNFVGGKTGYTSAARQTMTTVFEVPVQNATATVAIIVLGSENRQEDINALLSWFKSSAKLATTSTTVY